MQAIVKIGKSQHIVKAGDELVVDYGNRIDKVLLAWDDKGLHDDAKVTTKVVTDKLKGDKVRVAKFKAKSRYRKVIGFRPTLTRLKIESIKA